MRPCKRKKERGRGEGGREQGKKEGRKEGRSEKKGDRQEGKKKRKKKKSHDCREKQAGPGVSLDFNLSLSRRNDLLQLWKTAGFFQV
jgi:hypothetical protein